MPIFANYQIDMICSFFFLTRIFVCQADLPGTVVSSPVLKYIQVWLSTPAF